MTPVIAKRLAVCMLAVVFGCILQPTCTFAQEEDVIDVQIRVWPHALGTRSSGKFVTVHTDLPYNWVDGSTVTLSGIEIQSWKADDQGYFLAKFPMNEVVDEVMDLATAGKGRQVITLTFEGYTLDGAYFMGEDKIIIKDIHPKN